MKINFLGSLTIPDLVALSIATLELGLILMQASRMPSEI
jgi:hypothetical protein